ncbi:MAG: LPS biosynthesis protein WbpP [Gammaproteobacteria bacterium]|nr:MAG: LPS biosynthesis protein WbpP [Gammaproteobacteria bacterium]
MSAYEVLKSGLAQQPSKWLVTGAAGFIGSHLVERLLGLGQIVVGLDNFATGHQSNLDDVCASVGEQAWGSFTFMEADVCDLSACREASSGVDYVLHQAALGSVPRSIEEPITTNRANIDGFLNMLVASRDAGVKRFVYAASSSTYGDHPGLPKVEDKIGQPLSPYAVTKYVNELYADVFARTYGMECIGLRYFNVFGPLQDPQGAYAAVIPRWFEGLCQGVPPQINGDGETSRDFCFIDNTVQANLLAATTENPAAINQVYNVAVGGRTTLNELFGHIRELLSQAEAGISQIEPVYGEFRAGDVRHSQADISKARELLGYEPTHTVAQGLAATSEWFLQRQVKGL